MPPVARVERVEAIVNAMPSPTPAVIVAQPPVDREPEGASNLKTWVVSHVGREAIEAAATAEQASEDSRKAYNSGERVGEVIVAPFTTTAENEGHTLPGEGWRSKVANAALPWVTDQWRQGFDIAFSKKDVLGNEHENHAQALGASLSAGAAFATGIFGGATKEVGKGAVGFFIEPAVEAVKAAQARRDIREADERNERARSQEFLEIKEAKTGRPQDALGRALNAIKSAPANVSPIDVNSGTKSGDVASVPGPTDALSSQNSQETPSASSVTPDANTSGLLTIAASSAPVPQVPVAAYDRGGSVPVPVAPPLAALPESPNVSSFTDKLKANAQRALAATGDLQQAVLAGGASTVPMTGAALPTFTTPGDSVRGRMAPGVAPALLTVAGAAAAGAAAYGVARAVKKRRAKKAKAKNSKSTPRRAGEATRRSSRKSNARRAGGKKLSRRSSGKTRRGRKSDKGGIIPKTHKGKQVYIAKNGRPYVFEKRWFAGKVRSVPTFISV